MEHEKELVALEEIRATQMYFKKVALIIFIVQIIVCSAIMIFLPTIVSNILLQAASIVALGSIFGIVFLGRVALTITKRKYKSIRPHKRLSHYSEPEDMSLSLRNAFAEIEKRQDEDKKYFRI